VELFVTFVYKYAMQLHVHQPPADPRHQPKLSLDPRVVLSLIFLSVFLSFSVSEFLDA